MYLLATLILSPGRIENSSNTNKPQVEVTKTKHTNTMTRNATVTKSIALEQGRGSVVRSESLRNPSLSLNWQGGRGW